MSKHAHNPTYKATEKSKTAQFANPRHKGPTKRERRLEGRRRAHVMTTNDGKVEMRWNTKGYPIPGSLQ